MTDQTRQAPGRAIGRRQVLAALLALAILIPLGALFFGHHRYLSEHRALATQERDGIEYLLALGELTIALTDAQSAAVGGQPVSRESLAGALAAVAEVDERLGDELRVNQRWSQLRDTIERVTNTDHADGRAAYDSYQEANGLLLDLHDRLRETTGLVRDPDADAHHLQDAAGQRLPEAIVAAVGLVDLVNIAAGEPADGQAAYATEVSAAAATLTQHADQLIVGVQAALDSTQSRSLSNAVLGQYDRFLRAKDGLLATVPADGDVETAELGFLAAIRAELRAAGDDLYTTLITELDGLIENRLSELTRSQRIAVGFVSVGALLVFGLVAVSLVHDLRRPTRRTSPSQLPAGSGNGHGEGRELPPPRMPISSAAGSEPGPGTSPAGDRVTGQLLGSERVDVR